jgi:hypothetical protein
VRSTTTNRAAWSLGAELEDEIDAAFSLIVQFPEAAPQWYSIAFPSGFLTRSHTKTSSSSRSHTQAADQIIGRDVISVVPVDASHAVCGPMLGTAKAIDHEPCPAGVPMNLC